MIKWSGAILGRKIVCMIVHVLVALLLMILEQTTRQLWCHNVAHMHFMLFSEEP